VKTLESKKLRSVALITLGAISVSGIPTISIAATSVAVTHKAGPIAATVTNTLRNGKGVPTNSLGKNGDFYIDTLKLNIYGPKINGRWPTAVSLRGPAGTTGKVGAAGSKGATGKTGATGAQGSTKAATGAKGAQGVPGLTGQTGSVGATGTPGSVGATGSTGAVGATGKVGPSGTNGSNGSSGSAGATGSQGNSGSPGSIGLTGATGSQGTTGSPGSIGLTGGTGLQGATGAQGIQGTTGNPGATGPSNVTMGDITFSQILKGGTGASVASAPFGNFAASKQYFVRLHIYGVRSVTDFASVKISIYGVGGLPGIQWNYLVSDGRSYRTPLGENDTNLDVFITIDGSSVPTTFQLGAIISSQDDTSSDSVTFAGSYVSELVGSLS
jgi:hypothetical protein